MLAPSDAAKDELKNATDAFASLPPSLKEPSISSKDIQANIAATTKVLAESRAAVREGLRNSADQMGIAAAKTSQSARAYSSPTVREGSKFLKNLFLVKERLKNKEHRFAIIISDVSIKNGYKKQKLLIPKLNFF